VFAFDRFSSLTAQFQNDDVQSVAETVTQKVEAVIADVIGDSKSTAHT
jgi:hypothetical protein